MERFMTLAQNANMINTIEFSEFWNGVTFTFSNGWHISIQQGKNHYSRDGVSAEVAIFDDKSFWYGFDKEKGDIFKPEADTYIMEFVEADTIAKIISIISQEKVDIRPSE